MRAMPDGRHRGPDIIEHDRRNRLSPQRRDAIAMIPPIDVPDEYGARNAERIDELEHVAARRSADDSSSAADRDPNARGREHRAR